MRALADRAWPALQRLRVPVHRGMAWTTDAPYRETEEAIAAARAHGALAVEMEAAALYAFAQARGRDVLCFAHVTNQMAVAEGDFEKGEADGARDSLDVIAAAARALWFCVTWRETLMLTLYFAPGSSSMAPHIALHEIGTPFESRPLSFHKKENRESGIPGDQSGRQGADAADRRPAADRGRRHPVLPRAALPGSRPAADG